MNYKTLDKSGYQKGKFIPKNTSKYRGKYPIIFRSSWELAFMQLCDLKPEILSWGSESVIVEYVDITVKPPRTKRYFVDFNMTVKSGNTLKKYLIEIKPKHQTIPPIQPKNDISLLTERQKISYAHAINTYNRNILKWKAAAKAAKSKGMTFRVLTEDALFKK